MASPTNPSPEHEQQEQREIQVNDVVKLTNVGGSNYYVITSIIMETYPIVLHISAILNPADVKHILIDKDGQQTIKTVGINKSEIYQVEFLPNDQLSSTDILLTGIPDIDIQILLNLDDVTLTRMCQLDQYTRSLCGNSSLWRQKIAQRFGSIQTNPAISDKENYINLSKYPLTQYGLFMAAFNGNLPFMQWLIQEHPSLKKYINAYTLNTAVAHLDIIEWITTTYNIHPYNNTVAAAFERGSIRVLNWFNLIKLIDHDNTDFYAKLSIDSDHLTSLQWLIQNIKGFTITEEMVRLALKNGSMKILEYLKPQIIPLLGGQRENVGAQIINRRAAGTIHNKLNVSTILKNSYLKMAISNDNVPLAKFIMALDPTITSPTGSISTAVTYCHLNMVKYLRSLPSPQKPSKLSIEWAVKKGCTEVIQYFIDTEPSLIDSQKLKTAFKTAAQKGHVEMLEIGLTLIPPITIDLSDVFSQGRENILKIFKFAATLNPPLYLEPSARTMAKYDWYITNNSENIGLNIIKFLAHMPNPVFPSEKAIKSLIKRGDQKSTDILEYITGDPVIPSGLRMIAAGSRVHSNPTGST